MSLTSTTFIAADYHTSFNFQGWYLQATPQPIVCGPTEIYYTSGRYAGCVDPSSSFPIATSCSDSTLLRPSYYNVCGGQFSCGSYTIFPTEDSHYTQGVTEYACLGNWVANTIYRTLPARFASSTATPEITITESNTFDTFTTAQPTTTGSSTVTASPTARGSSSTSQHSSSGISGGAIAGIVVGSVAGVGLLVLLYIFRKKLVACFGRKPPSDGGPAWSPAYIFPQTQSMAQTDSTMQTSEMCSEQNAIHEIGSLQAASSTQPQAMHELSRAERTPTWNPGSLYTQSLDLDIIFDVFSAFRIEAIAS